MFAFLALNRMGVGGQNGPNTFRPISQKREIGQRLSKKLFSHAFLVA